MTTTAIFVEQVLIGFLAMLVVALAVVTDLRALAGGLGGRGEIVSSGAAVAAAYLVGIVLTGWTWRRINRTSLVFLRDYDAIGGGGAPASGGAR